MRSRLDAHRRQSFRQFGKGSRRKSPAAIDLDSAVGKRRQGGKKPRGRARFPRIDVTSLELSTRADNQPGVIVVVDPDAQRGEPLSHRLGVICL